MDTLDKDKLEQQYDIINSQCDYEIKNMQKKLDSELQNRLLKEKSLSRSQGELEMMVNNNTPAYIDGRANDILIIFYNLFGSWQGIGIAMFIYSLAFSLCYSFKSRIL